MALLGVNELMHDPDFVDTIQIILRTTKINSLGENKTEERCVDAVGSIQPADGGVIARLPEALRYANVSSFWIEGELPVTGAGKYPAVLVFRGNRYQVQMIFDFTNFGPGYTEGVCIMERPA